MEIPELYILRLSSEILKRIGPDIGFSGHNSTTLCGLLDLRHPRKNSIAQNCHSITELLNDIEFAISQNELLCQFITYISTPFHKSGSVSRDGESIVFTKLEPVIKDEKGIINEFSITLKAIMDSVKLSLLQFSTSKMMYYFAKTRNFILQNAELRNNFGKLFYHDWDEFAFVWKNTFPDEYNDANLFTDEILNKLKLDKFQDNFKEYRFRIPKLNSLWYFYAFYEVYPYVQVIDDNNIDDVISSCIELSGKIDDLLLPEKANSKEPIRKFSFNRKKRLKRFLEVLNSNSKHPFSFNKSISLYSFNKYTNLFDAFLLSMETEDIQSLDRRVDYNKNGKTYTKFTALNNTDKAVFCQKMKRNELIFDIGQATTLQFPGLTYRFLGSKYRHDYYYSIIWTGVINSLIRYFSLLALHCMKENDFYCDSRLMANAAFNNYLNIYNELETFDPYTNLIDRTCKNLTDHNRAFDWDKFFYSYFYLLDPKYPSPQSI